MTPTRRRPQEMLEDIPDISLVDSFSAMGLSGFSTLGPNNLGIIGGSGPPITNSCYKEMDGDFGL